MSGGHRGRGGKAQGNTCESTYLRASVAHVQDYRLILLAPSLGQPLLADRRDVGPAGAAVTSPYQANHNKEQDAQADEDRKISVAHSRDQISILSTRFCTKYEVHRVVVTLDSPLTGDRIRARQRSAPARTRPCVRSARER